MSREVLSVAPEDTIGEAAQLMADANVGSSVVLEHGRLIGILTERDLLRAMAQRVHPSEARVREWMTAEPMAVSESTSSRRGGPLDGRNTDSAICRSWTATGRSASSACGTSCATVSSPRPAPAEPGEKDRLEQLEHDQGRGEYPRGRERPQQRGERAKGRTWLHGEVFRQPKRQSFPPASDRAGTHQPRSASRGREREG